jgi:ribosomal protein L2
MVGNCISLVNIGTWVHNIESLTVIELVNIGTWVHNIESLTVIELVNIGTWVHNIEWNLGQGAKLIRAARTFVQIIKKFENTSQCIMRSPLSVDKLIDSQCQATISIMSNLLHGKHKLHKAGQSQWLGKPPIIQGVAINPVNHPHGGGEGRTKGGRPLISPWGKPSKGGF